MKRKISLDQALNYRGRDRLPGYKWEELRRKILFRDDICVICKKEVSMEVDHVVPVALGGSDSEDNLQGLCVDCHKKKTSQDIEKVKRARRFKKYKKRIVGFE